MKKSIIYVLSLFVSMGVFSRLTAQESKDEFVPSGKLILQSFFDYDQGFGSEKDDSGFDVTRALIGYQYKFTPTLSGQIVIDGASGVSFDKRLEVYLRNAFVKWKQDGFNVNFGLTGLQQSKLPEDYWEHRYVYKTFQDQYDMNPSVDLGISGSYIINDYLTADLSFVNGSGYKNVELSGSKKIAVGVNVWPIKGWVVRLYGDLYNESEKMRGELPEYILSYDFENQYTFSIFSGYQNNKFSVGAEFNKQFNKQFIADKNYYGYSVYGSLSVAPKWSIYGRYDILESNKPPGFQEDWNQDDGQLIIAGVQFNPNKYLKISPNFRNINPDRSKSQQYLFINVEFNL